MRAWKRAFTALLLGNCLIAPLAARPAAERESAANAVVERTWRDALGAEVRDILADAPGPHPSPFAIEMAIAMASPALDGLGTGEAARLVIDAALEGELSYRLGVPRQQVMAEMRQQMEVARSQGSAYALEQLRRVRVMGAGPRGGNDGGRGPAGDAGGPGGRAGTGGARAS